MTKVADARKPDLDPGPRFDKVRSKDPAYQLKMVDARESISRFRELLRPNGTPRLDALTKTRLIDGYNSAFMWLNNTALTDMSDVEKLDFDQHIGVTEYA